MRPKVALLVGLLSLAAFLLAAPASGSTIRMSSNSYTGVALRTVTFDPGGVSIACDLTFTIAVSGTPLTSVSLPATFLTHGRVRVRPSCSSSTTLTPLGEPWFYDVVINGGAGNVTGSTTVTIKNVQFELVFAPGWPRCLYAGDIVATIGSAGTTMFVNARLPLVGGPIICWNPLVMTGSIALSPSMTFILS